MSALLKRRSRAGGTAVQSSLVRVWHRRPTALPNPRHPCDPWVRDFLQRQPCRLHSLNCRRRHACHHSGRQTARSAVVTTYPCYPWLITSKKEKRREDFYLPTLPSLTTSIVSGVTSHRTLTALLRCVRERCHVSSAARAPIGNLHLYLIKYLRGERFLELGRKYSRITQGGFVTWR